MKYIFIVFLLFSFGNSYSQEKSFNNLLVIFENGKDQEIDSVLAKKYFNFTPDDNAVGFQTLHSRAIVFQNDKFIGLSAYSSCGAGGMCESAFLVVFDKKGKVIDRLTDYEEYMSDCSFSDMRECIYGSDSLIIIIDKSETGDCIEDTTFTIKIKVESIQIDYNGKFAKKKRYEIDTRRENYIASTEILTHQYLIYKTKNQLSVIRNEIFAAHGYKFKTEKWQKYFSKKNWYKPKYENVNDKLSFIEKENIALILKYEKK